MLTFSSHRCFAALFWAAVRHPSLNVGTHPGAAGFFHGAVGVTMVYDAGDTMMHRFPKVTPHRWVSMARVLARRSLRMAWLVWLVWYGMVWYGMVWYGMLCYGVVWYGVV
jgi:hypothetical protein